MNWNEVVTILKTDTNWGHLHFNGETEECERLIKTLGFRISAVKRTEKSFTIISNLIEDGVIERVRSCGSVTVSHKSKYYVRCDFKILFTKDGKVISTEKSVNRGM